MGPFHRGSRARYVLILLVLTALSLMTLDGRDVGPVATMRSAAMSVLSPFRAAADWVVSPIGNVWHGITGYDELEEENAELRRQLSELEGAQLREASATALMERWLEQTEIEFGQDIEQVTARVVDDAPSSFEATVTIDKGSDHGIEEGMAVVTGAGLVGRIERVSASESVVLLITDSRMAVATRIVDSQDVGMLHGEGPEKAPRLEVLEDAELSDGDILQTSGLENSLYPPAVPIGRVVRVPDESTEPDDASAEVEEGDIDEDDTTATTTGGASVIPGLDPVSRRWVDIEPAARLDRLNFLTVLLWQPPR